MAHKVVITGASGLLGRAVCKEFRRHSNDWKVTGLAYRRAEKHGLVRVDLTNAREVDNILKQEQPDVVVHCAAERRPDVVEKQAEATRQLNVDATQNVRQAAEAVGAYVIFISTDYVFDGSSPPYKITDKPCPLNNYGRSKLDGEEVVLCDGGSSKHIVLRIPIMYGDVEDLGESAVTIIFPIVKNNDVSCVCSDYERRYPTHAADIASVILQISNKRTTNTEMSGIYHWSGPEMLTKYGMALVMATAFKLPSSHIQPDIAPPSSGTMRPYDAHLDCTDLLKLGIQASTPFQEGIKAVLQDWTQGPNRSH